MRLQPPRHRCPSLKRQDIIGLSGTRGRSVPVHHHGHPRFPQLRQQPRELPNGRRLERIAVVTEQHRRRDRIARPLLAQVGRDQPRELRCGYLRPHYGGLGRPGPQQVDLGRAGRRCGREVAGHDDDVVPGQLAGRQRAAQVVTEQHDDLVEPEDVAGLLLQARQRAGRDLALGGQAALGGRRVGQSAELLRDFQSGQPGRDLRARLRGARPRTSSARLACQTFSRLAYWAIW